MVPGIAAWFLRPWGDGNFPERFACFGVVSGDVRAYTRLTTGCANHNDAIRDQRFEGGIFTIVIVTDRALPRDLAGLASSAVSYDRLFRHGADEPLHLVLVVVIVHAGPDQRVQTARREIELPHPGRA